jgi:hypothetical protein
VCDRASKRGAIPVLFGVNDVECKFKRSTVTCRSGNHITFPRHITCSVPVHKEPKQTEWQLPTGIFLYSAAQVV